MDALLRKKIVQPSKLGASVFRCGDTILQSVKVRTETTGYRIMLRILVERHIRLKEIALNVGFILVHGTYLLRQ